MTGDFASTGTITTPGAVTVSAVNAAFNTTTATGVVSVTASGLTTLNGVVSGSDATVKTATLTTNPGGGLQAAGTVTILPSVAGRDIQLAGPDPGPARCGSSTATLNAITAPAVVVGDPTNTDDILVAGNVTPPGFNTLTLRATGSVDQLGGAKLTLNKLTAVAADVNLRARRTRSPTWPAR